MDQTFFLITVFIFGAIVGSFLNVVIWRLPQGKSLGGRSQCPHCHHILTPLQLIPLVSYIWQRGKCANCGKPVSGRYISIEAITGLLFVLAAIHFTHLPLQTVEVVELVRALIILSLLIVVFVIDLEHYLILDKVVFSGSILIVIGNVALDVLSKQSFNLHSHTIGGLLAAIVASGFFYLIWRVSNGKWMGFGDVKFAILLGLALGWPGILVGLFAAFMIGAIIGIALMAGGSKTMQSRLPFGTFLGLGALLALFYGPRLVQWYAQLIGWY